MGDAYPSFLGGMISGGSISAGTGYTTDSTGACWTITNPFGLAAQPQQLANQYWATIAAPAEPEKPKASRRKRQPLTNEAWLNQRVAEMRVRL